MPGNIAIRITGVGKQYRIGGAPQPVSLRETLNNAVAWPVRILTGRKPRRESDKNTFWALQDISFEVERGEVVGVIGRNGSGKSTLLKILSRVTEPTKGRIELHGRVGSLLEVGTGFHHELTGRENIFLNGAILGMRKEEIARKFDQIVEFAEVVKFIDTPVKHYSSGMYLRLAFSVAAHLESEILIVDEVLAVGDAGFQKKCLGRMGEVSREGRTVLFVSHNMTAVQQLTTKGVVLQSGVLDYTGSTEGAIERYLLNAGARMTEVYIVGQHGQRLSGYSRAVEFVSFELRNHSNKMIEADQDVVIHVVLRAHENMRKLRLSATVFSTDGTPVGSTFGPECIFMNAGTQAAFEFRLAGAELAPGNYYFAMGVGTGNPATAQADYDVVMEVAHFEKLAPQGEAGTKSTWPKSWGFVRFPPAIIEAVQTAGG